MHSLTAYLPAALLALSACAQDARNVDVGVGAVAGGSPSAQVGSDRIASRIGDRLTPKDRQVAEVATRRVLEQADTGQTIRWRNPDSGNSGAITATRHFEADGEDCTEFSQSVSADGRTEAAVGLACRQPDGTWSVRPSG